MTWILAIIAAICATGWAFSRLAFKTLVRCFKEKGYPMVKEKDIQRNMVSIIKEINWVPIASGIFGGLLGVILSKVIS